MTRSARPPRTRPAGSPGPTSMDDLRTKVDTKVHGKPEDNANFLYLFVEYITAPTPKLDEAETLYKMAPPAIKNKLAQAFPTHEVIVKNHKGKIAGSSSNSELDKAVAKAAKGDKGKKKLKTKSIDELLAKGFDGKDIDKALEALNEKEG